VHPLLYNGSRPHTRPLPGPSHDLPSTTPSALAFLALTLLPPGPMSPFKPLFNGTDLTGWRCWQQGRGRERGYRRRAGVRPASGPVEDGDLVNRSRPADAPAVAEKFVPPMIMTLIRPPPVRGDKRPAWSRYAMMTHLQDVPPIQSPPSKCRGTSLGRSPVRPLGEQPPGVACRSRPLAVGRSTSLRASAAAARPAGRHTT